MQQIINNIILLKENNENWKELFAQYIDDKDIEENVEKQIIEIIDGISAIYKTTKEIPKEILEVIDDEEIAARIDDFIGEILAWYFDLELLRMTQEEDVEKAKKLAEIIFLEFILYKGATPAVKICDLFGGPEKCDAKLVAKLITALSFFADSSIENRASQENISLKLKDTGDIREEVCESFSKILFENRIEYKLNLIMNSK